MLIENFKIVGINPKFLKAIEIGRNLAVTKLPALICGEMGTGKNSLSHYIHENSNRRMSKFIIVDCSQKHEEVEKSILGYRDEQGKFHKGALESANTGTVVFSNIDCLEESFQRKLQLILCELKDYDLDVRLMATTAKNLSKYVATGRFDRQLYMFFSDNQVNMPALRDRKEDFHSIISYFLGKFSEKRPELAGIRIHESALMKVSSIYWTHNYFELENVLIKSIDFCENGFLTKSSIEFGEKKSSPTNAEGEEGTFKLMSLKEAERLLIKKALIHTSENRTQAAKILGVSIRTLRNKINEYRDDGSQFFLNLR